MAKPKSGKLETLLVRMHDEAKILRAAAVLVDGRTSYSRSLRRTSDLLSEAAMFIEGVQASGRKLR